MFKDTFDKEKISFCDLWILLTLLKRDAQNLWNSSIYYEKYHDPQTTSFP